MYGFFPIHYCTSQSNNNSLKAHSIPFMGKYPCLSVHDSCRWLWNTLRLMYIIHPGYQRIFIITRPQ